MKHRQRASFGIFWIEPFPLFSPCFSTVFGPRKSSILTRMSRIIPVSGMSLFEVLPHCFGLLTKAEVAALDIQIEMNCPSVQKEGSFHTHSRVTSHESRLCDE